MQENTSLIIPIGADPAPLEAALKTIEQSTNNLASKLDKGFGLLDVRIGVLKRNFAALDAQATKTGGILGRSIEMFGSISNLPLLETLGKELGRATSDTEQLNASFDRLFEIEPGPLLSKFKDLESQLNAIGVAADVNIPARDIANDIFVLKGERKQVFDALSLQASEVTKKLQDLIAFDGTLPDTPPARGLIKRLEEFRDIFQQVEAATDDPRIKSLIGRSPVFRDLPRRQRGALEPREPGRVLLALTEAGPASDANGVSDLAEAQSVLTTAVERSGRSLEEQTGTLRNLDGAVHDLGFTFASSFEGAVVEGKRLSDVLQGLGQDILRILTRKFTGFLTECYQALVMFMKFVYRSIFHPSGNDTPIWHTDSGSVASRSMG